MSPSVVRAAKRHKKTAAAVFYRWMQQIGAVPLSGTTNTQHMADDVDIYGFVLTEEEMREVARVTFTSSR